MSQGILLGDQIASRLMITTALVNINDLPNELLTYIFQIGLDASDVTNHETYTAHDLELVDQEDWEYGRNSGGKDVPAASEMAFQVLVSLVCKRWEEVSYGSPPLWTHISINQNTHIELVQTWMTRSRTSPLSIKIDCQLDSRHNLKDGEYEYMNASTDLFTRAKQIRRYPLQKDLILSRKELSDFLDLLITQITRWKSFQVEATFYSYIYIILERLAKAPPADILQDLQLHDSLSCDISPFNIYYPAKLRKAFKLFQGSAPKLQSISLWGVYLDWEGSLPMLADLQKLVLSYHSVDVRPSHQIFRAILDGSPHLDTLVLMESGPSEPMEDWPSNDILECPSVRKVELRGTRPGYASKFIDKISLPRVKEMTVAMRHADFSLFATQLSDPAPRRSQSLLSQLENLNLIALDLEVQSVYLMLGQSTDLKHIDLDSFSWQDNHFLDLPSLLVRETSMVTIGHGLKILQFESKLDGSPRYFCSNLGTLTVHGGNGDEPIRFILFRKNAGPPLTRLFVPGTEIDL